MAISISTALVTGAGSGIGKAFCDLLAQKKINLIISSRDRDRLEALAKEWRRFVDVEVISADLSHPYERCNLVECIHKRVPDLIVNNAGFGFYGNALSHSASSHLEMLEVDCAAVLELTLEGIKALTVSKKKGIILNVSSAAAFQVFPYFATYSSCKAFVNHLSRSLDEEFKSQGIRILASCPGMVETHFRERAGGGKGTSPGVMKVSFAAEQLWKQIIQEKQIYIFDWKFRMATFFSQFIPQSLLSNLLQKIIRERKDNKT